jgi:hypothetical protein
MGFHICIPSRSLRQRQNYSIWWFVMSCGTFFCMAMNIISYTYEITFDPSLRFYTCHHVSSFIMVVYAVNLQCISNILQRLWAFSLVLDSATHQNTSYFDLHIRVYVEEHHTIANLHGCVLPMFQWHMGEVMFEMVSNFLIIFCPNWKIRLLGLSSDKAWNMIKRVDGIVTRFQDSMHDNCFFFHI